MTPVGCCPAQCLSCIMYPPAGPDVEDSGVRTDGLLPGSTQQRGLQCGRVCQVSGQCALQIKPGSHYSYALVNYICLQSGGKSRGYFKVVLQSINVRMTRFTPEKHEI